MGGQNHSKRSNAMLCQDIVIGNRFWHDSFGFTCRLYEGANWCANGGRGDGWREFWGGFNNYKKDGYNGRTACCGCGGGNKNPDTFNSDLPMYSGVDVYPYADIDQYWTASDVDDGCRHSDKPEPCIPGNVWSDAFGYSCLAYYYGDFCTVDGEQGPGWDLGKFGPVESYYNPLASATNPYAACGACGGGTADPTPESTTSMTGCTCCDGRCGPIEWNTTGQWESTTGQTTTMTFSAATESTEGQTTEETTTGTTAATTTNSMETGTTETTTEEPTTTTTEEVCPCTDDVTGQIFNGFTPFF